MTPPQIAEGQRLAAAFVPERRMDADDGQEPRSILEMEGMERSRERERAAGDISLGTGFFIDGTGHLLTAHHVVDQANRIQVRTADGTLMRAHVVRADPANDVAVLKVAHRPDRWLSCAPNAEPSLGQPVFTIGFPNASIQGLEPKFSDGKISAVSGIQDDPRHLQTSLPATNGNSGGPLLDARAQVVGLIVLKLNDLEMLKHSGNTGQNVSYALKTTYFTGLLPVTASPASPTPAPGAHPQFDSAAIDLARQAVVLIVAE